jgi:predicted nucleotidyltransferase
MNPYKELQKYAIEPSELDVLFACESGSRAWGFESRDSDYDIRFVYLEPQYWHLSLAEKKRDTGTSSISTEEGEIDAVGWELSKFLKLMRKSNASVFDWLNSPIVYYEAGRFTQQVRVLADLSFSPGRVSYHSLNLARQHHRKYIAGQDLVGVKKYIYTIRALLTVQWIQENNTFPPVLLTKLLNGIDLPNRYFHEFWFLVERKNNGLEKDTMPTMPFWNDYIVKAIDDWEAMGFETGKVPDIHPYNTALLSLLQASQPS